MNSNSQKSNKYTDLMRWCTGETDDYLRRRNDVQVSENSWGAAAQALKAIAEDRSCNHSGHGPIVDIAQRVADEQGGPDYVAVFGIAQALHVNLYENWLSSDTVAIYLDDVKMLLPELERVRSEPPSAILHPRDTLQRHATNATAGGGYSRLI
jgi:hypothetical protein